MACRRPRGLQTPGVTDADGAALAIQVLEQRDGVLPGGIETFPEHSGRDLVAFGQFFAKRAYHSVDAVLQEVQVVAHADDCTGALEYSHEPQ
jgi:hypothetical protein